MGDDMNAEHKDQQVVVGYDASRESDFALQWAARVAQRRQCALLIVSATGVDQTSVELARPGIQEMYLRQAQRTSEAGAEQARRIADDIDIQSISSPGDAASALIESAEKASLLVIGHRARGLLPDLILGSVAFKVTHHANCPVAVIRRSPRPLPSMEYPVVAGVDGSEHGVRALQEAARLAADTGSFLRIVVAWRRPNWKLWARASSLNILAEIPESPPPADDQGHDDPVYQQIVADTEQQAQKIARQAAEQVLKRYPALKIEQIIREGAADQAILSAATDASMIAVGARGLGGLQALHLGSISRKVMQRAECAVYVVR